MSLLEDVRTRLVNAGVANTSWPCYIGYTPDDTDQAISLQFTGGFQQDTQQGENVLETFQAKVRAAKLAHSTCETKWRALFNALQSQETAVGVSLLLAVNSGPITWNDDKNRPNMSINWRVQRLKP